VKQLLRCLIASFVLTVALAGWILFIPTGSTVAFAVMFPAIWLTSTVAGPLIAASDTGGGGPAYFIALVLLSTILNIA